MLIFTYVQKKTAEKIMRLQRQAQCHSPGTNQAPNIISVLFYARLFYTRGKVKSTCLYPLV